MLQVRRPLLRTVPGWVQRCLEFSEVIRSLRLTGLYISARSVHTCGGEGPAPPALAFLDLSEHAVPVVAQDVRQKRQERVVCCQQLPLLVSA